LTHDAVTFIITNGDGDDDYLNNNHAIFEILTILLRVVIVRTDIIYVHSAFNKAKDISITFVSISIILFFKNFQSDKEIFFASFRNCEKIIKSNDLRNGHRPSLLYRITIEQISMVRYHPSLPWLLITSKSSFLNDNIPNNSRYTNSI